MSDQVAAPPIRFHYNNKKVLSESIFGISCTLILLYNLYSLTFELIHHESPFFSIILILVSGLFMVSLFKTFGKRFGITIEVDEKRIRSLRRNGNQQYSVHFKNVIELQMVQRKSEGEPLYYLLLLPNDRGFFFDSAVENYLQLITIVEERTGKKFLTKWVKM